MSWYLIFLVSSFPAVLLAYIDFSKSGINLKNRKSLLLFFIAVGATVNLIYTPLDHYESLEELKKIQKQSLEHQKNYDSLKKENSALSKKNMLLKERLELLDMGFNKYRKQIIKLSMNINVTFLVKSNEDVSSQSVIPAPSTIYSIGEGLRGERILFQTQDNSYSYHRLASMSGSSIYRFSVNSDVIDGKFPLGKPTSSLKDIQFLKIFVPTFKNIYRDDPSKRSVTILASDVLFTLNGKELKKLTQNPNTQTTTSIGPCHYQGDDGWICYSFPLMKNLYEELDLSKF